MPKKKRRVAEHTDEITATGIIIPATWDHRGKPVSIMLATYDEEEFLVSMATVAGKQLREQLQKKVCVTGRVGRNLKNKRLIEVNRFEMIQDETITDGSL